MFTKEKAFRIIILFLGLVVAHLGVTLFLLADLGADPFNVLIQGLFRFLGARITILTHGTTHMAVCFLIIIILFLTKREYIKIGTLVCMFFGGPIIDFFSWILTSIHIEKMNIVLKVLILVLGCVILAFGMTIVIRSDAGTGPNDLVAVVISETKNWKFGVVRITVDFLFILTGFLLGGKFGVGTIICAFLVGPIADLFLPKSDYLVKRSLACLKNSMQF